MEHFRRLGISKAVRSLGPPGDHATDVAYYTRLSQSKTSRGKIHGARPPKILGFAARHAASNNIAGRVAPSVQ
jgi:hypothetical protein